VSTLKLVGKFILVHIDSVGTLHYTTVESNGVSSEMHKVTFYHNWTDLNQSVGTSEGRTICPWINGKFLFFWSASMRIGMGTHKTLFSAHGTSRVHPCGPNHNKHGNRLGRLRFEVPKAVKKSMLVFWVIT
jgi:hypothetical protein